MLVLALSVARAEHAYSQSRVPAVRVADLTVDGIVPPPTYADLLLAGIAPIIDDLRGCLLATPGSGQLRLRLWVSARQVIRTTVLESSIEGELQRCAVARIRTIRLPDDAPPGGAEVKFTLHFEQAR